MHQTTYGETHKISEIADGKIIADFLAKNKNSYDNFSNASDCLYADKLIIDDPAINYLNDLSEKNIDRQLKYLIRSEYSKLWIVFFKLAIFTSN